MKSLNWLIAKTQNSPFHLWVLNFIAARFVPFNRPHSFQIKKITPRSIYVELPYKKNNINHIKGIHACALATLCEYSTGLVLLTATDINQYRVILKNIHVTYHYQAKTKVFAKFEVTPEWINTTIIEPLKTVDAVFSELKIDIYDQHNRHVCTGFINWQVKSWKNVKTK